VANWKYITIVSVLVVAILGLLVYDPPWSRLTTPNPSSSTGGNGGSGYTSHNFNVFVSGEQWSGQVTSDGHTVFDGSGFGQDSWSVTGYSVQTQFKMTDSLNPGNTITVTITKDGQTCNQASADYYRWAYASC